MNGSRRSNRWSALHAKLRHAAPAPTAEGSNQQIISTIPQISLASPFFALLHSSKLYLPYHYPDFLIGLKCRKALTNEAPCSRRGRPWLRRALS